MFDRSPFQWVGTHPSKKGDRIYSYSSMTMFNGLNQVPDYSTYSFLTGERLSRVGLDQCQCLHFQLNLNVSLSGLPE